MAESCKLSAVTLALRSLTNNEELTRRLAGLAEESNVAYLYSDALKEDIIEGVSDANKLASEYTLKKESADIKFKAVLFGSLLANTKQGDEAIDMLMKEIGEQGGTAAEGLGLIDLMSRMDLSGMDEAARVVFNTTQEEATRIVEEMRTKISNYVGSEYSLVTSGSNIKAKKVVRQLNKELDDAVKVLDDAKADLGEDVFDDVDKDLNKLNAVHKKGYWSTKEGKAEIKKIADKYGVPPTKGDVEKYLKKISDAKKTAAEQVDRVDEIIETYDAAVEGDLKLIENGQNPFNYIGADSEWKFIKGFNNDVSTRVQQYGQYMLARTLLTDNGEVPQRLYDMLVKTISAETKGGITNYIGEPLTEDWILSKDRTLDELMSRAYMNTAQLVKDGNLRRIYRQQLIALASDDMLSKADVEFVEDLINTMKFAEAGAGFSTVLKYNALVNRCKELGVDIKGKSGKGLWNSIKSFLTSDDFEKKLEAGDILTLGNGVQVTKRQLLELVVNMTGDLNVKKAVALNQWTDSSLIGVAAKYLMGDTVGGRKRLMDLIGAAKATATTDDIRGMILKSLTGKNVPIGTPVAFFDFRKGLKAEADVRYRAKYMETLANANKINLPDNTIEDITTDAVNTLVGRLEKLRGGFVLVNDSQWKMNSVLCDALDIVNKGRKAEERVNILAPKGGLMGQVKRENGKLVFKTMYSDVFNNFLEDIALKTFGTSMADTKFTKDLLDRLAKGDLDAIAESNKILEQDAKEYYAQMLGVDVYSEDLIPMLEEMTGISFKSYDAIIDKAEFRKKVDDAFMLEGKVLGTYSQEITTVSNVINEINAMTTDQIAGDLSYRFGYTITKGELEADGVIKDEIKNAYINYKLAQTPLELLERKGRLIAKINGGTADNITTNQFRSMIQSKDFEAYKEIFFGNAEMSDELLETMTRKINDMIFDNLGAELADRLVDMGYSLPLMNIRELVFDWANGTLDTNNSFVRAFFAKNGLDPTMSTLNGILDQAMPTDLRFAYDNEVMSFVDEGYSVIGKEIESFEDPRYGNITVLSDGTLLKDGYRWRGQSADWINKKSVIDDLNTPSVINGKTVGDLANEYNIPVMIAQDDWLRNIGHASALGRTNVTRASINGERFVQTMINFKEEVTAGTASHEIFHAIFGTLTPREQDYFLRKAADLYKMDNAEANEMLADLFSEYFNTGSFKLPRDLAKDKEFASWIEKFFIKVSAWLGFADEYEDELGKLFDDILNGKLQTTTKRIGRKEIEKRNKENIEQWKAFLERGSQGRGMNKTMIGNKNNFLDYTKRLIETPNEFQQDTYSSLISMAAIKDGARLSGGGNERDLLAKMLDDYYKAFEKAFEGGKEISFKEAQEIKTRMGYALDMFEQDYISPRYGQFLTPDERSEVFGLKYALGVTTSKSGLKTIKDYNERVMNRFTDATSRVLGRADALSSNLSKSVNSINEEIQKRQQQLIDQGATMKVVNGQAVVVDIRNEIRKQMNNLPSNIHGLDALKTLGRTGLNQLSNAEAYFILNLIELAKNAENRMNLITKTIYKVCPQLAKVDFFNTFRMVGELPEALQGNLLLGTKGLSKYENTTTFDIEVKKGIFSDIKDEFKEGGQLTYDRLTKIINKNIDNNVNLLGGTVSGRELKTFKKEAAITYQGAFNLYTLLKDVPKEVKLEIDNILNQQRQGITDALNMLGDGNRLVDVMDEVSILCSDGTVKTFRQALEGENESISKILFNESSDVVKEADEAAMQTIDKTRSPRKQRAVKRENELTVEKTNNNYLEGLNAYLNGTEVISQAERDLINTTRTSARQIAKQYTLTNKLAETDNALASINEAIMRDFKINILGFLGNITQGGQNIRWIKGLSDNIITDVMAKWKEVQDRYRVLYNMSYEELMAYKSRAAKNSIDNMALNLALYFKEIERRLGSLDGLTGGTTSREVNMAFAHLGEVVGNIDSITSLFSLMSGVEGNQILKFFRFANPGDAARINEFIIGGVGKQYLGGYRNFVDKTDEGLNLKWFNTTFGANLSDTEYRKLIQALCGFTITSGKMKGLEKALNFVNQSNYLFRTLVSYPGQMITIHPQNIGYWLRQLGHEESLGAEDLGTIDAIREPTGILNETYNEINLFRYASPDDTNPTSFYNRYGIPDVNGLMREEKLYTSDDLETMYSKIDKYGSKGAGYYYDKFIRNTDAYKDNFNNFIDGTFARNFKNIAFLKALQSNEYMKFATATQFAEFMAGDAPEYMKTKLMQAVAEASGRNFRNILGLGFSGLDRAIGGSAIRNVGIGLMQMFNFRGAWGQNIARQTWNWLSTSIKMARSGLSKEGRDAMALYIAKQPEFVNFSSQLFNDLKYSWFLTKYQDNGDWPVDGDDLNWIDFIQYGFETLQFSSQRWQGIQSYGLTRIISETAESAIQSARDPEIYKDTLGIGALMNAMSKNLGRNWKVPNLVVRTLAQNGTDAKRAYLQNEFWKLSYGSLRYLMNEDENGSGYNTELIKNRPGAIPFVISGEVSEDGDKAFSYDLANTETWLNIQNWFDAIDAGDGDAARAYFMNNLDSFFNASQMLGTVKNVGRALAGSSLIGDKTKDWLADDFHVYKFGSPFDLAEVGDAVDGTVAGHEFMKNGYYRPTDGADVKILIKEVMGQADYRPGNNGFNKSMFNFDEYGHMAGENGASKDATMEFLLENIKYERDANFNFKVDDNGKRIVNKDWEIHMKEMARRNNDANYMTYANFNFINNRVEANNDDPNYMMYRRLIGEGLAGRYTTQAINDIMDEHNKKHGLKKTAKLTKEDLEKKGLYDVIYPQLVSRQTYITGEKMDFLTSIMLLDKEAAMSANLKMIARQLAEKGEDAQIKKLFNFNKDGEITLGTKYEGYLKEQAKLGRALEEGDIEKFRAETASITRMYRDEDPYGIMTTVLVASRIKRINDADSLSAEQKAKAIDALFEDNYDFIQTHIPQLIDAIGSKSEALAYVEQMNESIYDTSYIGDKLVADNEMAGSKSGRSAAVRVSTKAKNLLGKLGSAAGGSSTSGSVGGGKKYNYNFVPVKLDGAKFLKATGGKGYTPITSSSAIKTYKTHADFSTPKDINRKIKTKKTQTVSTKKQLSNIETKTTKALEAES